MHLYKQVLFQKILRRHELLQYTREDHFDVDKFRPISVLPALSKILKRAIHDQLYSYLNVNKLLANCQSGFRPSYSTAIHVLLKFHITSLIKWTRDIFDWRYFPRST